MQIESRLKIYREQEIIFLRFASYLNFSSLKNQLLNGRIGLPDFYYFQLLEAYKKEGEREREIKIFIEIFN